MQLSKAGLAGIVAAAALGAGAGSLVEHGPGIPTYSRKRGNKYQPHQGEREKARRLRKAQNNG